MDLVVTVPKRLWMEWLAEGDCAGDPPSGEEYGFFTSRTVRPHIEPGERLYIVAFDRVRGYAPVTRLALDNWGRGPQWMLVREGGAVAVTIPEAVKGFRGWRKRWWGYEQERPFPMWRAPLGHLFDLEPPAHG